MRRISTLNHQLGLMASMESEEVVAPAATDAPADGSNVVAEEGAGKGALIGAGAGLLIAGIPGAIVGGVAGGMIGHGMSKEDGEVDPKAEAPADDLHPEDPPVDPLAEPAAPAEGEAPAAAEVPAEAPAGDTPAAPAEGEAPAELPAEAPIDAPADTPAEVVPGEGESVIPAAAIAEPAPETDPANPTAPVDEAPAAPAEGESPAVPAEGETPPAEGEPVAAEVPETGEHAPAEPADEEHDTASLDADLATIEASKEQGEDNDAEQDEAVEVKEALESFADIVGASVQHNGLDAYGAELLGAMTTRLYKQVGFSAAKQSSVSLESFDPATSTIADRRKASLEAFEDIKQKVDTIWKAIVAALKRSVEWVKSHFKKIFDAAVLVERSANQMVARAAKVKEVEHKTEGLTDTRVAGGLSINGKPSKDLRGDVSHLAGMVDIVLGSMQKDAEEVGKRIAYNLENMDDDIGEDFKRLTKKVDGFEDAAGFEAPEGVKVARSKEMLGGKAIVQMYPESLEAVKQHISACSITLRPYAANASDAVAAATVTPWLTPGEVGHCAQAVADMAKNVRLFRNRLDELVALQERCAKFAENLISNAKADDDKTFAEKKRNLARYAQHLPKLVSEPFTSFSHYVLSTGRNVLELGNLSLKGS